jgi:hypothetical protein
MKNIKETAEFEKVDLEKVESKKVYLEVMANKQIRELSLLSLKYLSLSDASHKEIFKNENLSILVPLLEEIHDFFKHPDSDSFDK